MSDQNINHGPTSTQETKFCSECGKKIAKRAVVCPHCGCRLEEGGSRQNIVINNQNNNVGAGAYMGDLKNKWIALALWFFLGFLGAHKFYEGKILMGIFYIFTVGFFGIGLFIDFWALLFKPTLYHA